MTSSIHASDSPEQPTGRYVGPCVDCGRPLNIVAREPDPRCIRCEFKGNSERLRQERANIGKGLRVALTFPSHRLTSPTVCQVGYCETPNSVALVWLGKHEHPDSSTWPHFYCLEHYTEIKLACENYEAQPLSLYKHYIVLNQRDLRWLIPLLIAERALSQMPDEFFATGA